MSFKIELVNIINQYTGLGHTVTRAHNIGLYNYNKENQYLV